MAYRNLIAVFGIGSTNLHSAIADPDGNRIFEHTSERTELDRLCEQVLARLDAFDSDFHVDGVGIATTGLVDGMSVREVDTPDGSVIEDIPLGYEIQERYDVPVTIENDCTAAAIAEWEFGAGRGYDCVVHVTMGTGIGAGVVDHGHVVRGADGHAVEVGLIPVGPFDRESCGVPGAWEAYCSGRGIREFVRDRLATESRSTSLPSPEVLTSRDVFDAAMAGDAVANDYLEDICHYNAAGLGAVINAYNPDLLTIGGGVGGSNFDVLIDRTGALLESFCLTTVPRIEPTQLGDRIGLYGALAAFFGPSLPDQDRRRTPTLS